MGNAIMCAFPPPLSPRPTEPVVKLVHSNGLIEEFYRPVLVGELSPDYPHHFICHAHSLLSALIAHPRPPFAAAPSEAAVSLALADDIQMQVGQIYLLLPRDVNTVVTALPAVSALLSKASVASSKDSYRDIHVVPFSDEPLFDECSLLARTTPVSNDFLRQLLAESRLLLPTSISGPSLVGPSQEQPVSSSPSVMARFSDLDSWRPGLETIFEESGLSVY